MYGPNTAVQKVSVLFQHLQQQNKANQANKDFPTCFSFVPGDKILLANLIISSLSH